MMSPTSQLKAEHIFDKISVLTFSSLPNLDIVVVLNPVNARKSFFLISLSISIFHSFL